MDQGFHAKLIWMYGNLKYYFTNKLRCLLGNKNVETYCPVCNKQGISFLPLPEFYRQSAEKYGYKYFGCGEMTALSTYLCPICGASDRERLYALWLEQQIEMGTFEKGSTIIHFAPEYALSQKIKSFDYFSYQSADLTMENVDHVVDLIKLPFKNNTFDMFICSHVLEHVEDDDLAISELFRVIKKGGCGILMAPIIVGLKKTIEDKTIVTEEERWRYFGQNDHVRLYAHNDYVQKLKNNGFLLSQLGVRHFGKQIYRRLGLKSTSILYIVRKP